MKAYATNVRLMIDIEWRDGNDLYKADQAISVLASQVMPSGQYKKLLVHLAKFVKALPQPKPIPGKVRPAEGEAARVVKAAPKALTPPRIVGVSGETLIS